MKTNIELKTNIEEKTKYISGKSDCKIRNLIKEAGFTLKYVVSEGIVDEAISCHPDIFMCRLGAEESAPIFHGEKEKLGGKYPADIRYNAACTGKFFIHNLKYTDPLLLKSAEDLKMTFIDVKQGYSKCNITVVDENSIITSDMGIVKACEKVENLSVLAISPGYVRLPGFDTGFIGGASGRMGKKIIFNGALRQHPDFERIKDFIEKRGLECIWIEDYPMTDIGTII